MYLASIVVVAPDLRDGQALIDVDEVLAVEDDASAGGVDETLDGEFLASGDGVEGALDVHLLAGLTRAAGPGGGRMKHELWLGVFEGCEQRVQRGEVGLDELMMQLVILSFTLLLLCLLNSARCVRESLGEVDRADGCSWVGPLECLY
jgi:hypothetical protein